MTTTAAPLDSIQTIVQEDVGVRGLRSDPGDNLISACPNDFRDCARALAGRETGNIGILTGFYIPYAEPPAGETDGPLGAVFLARALIPLGYRIVIYGDGFCVRALEAGLKAAGLSSNVRIVELPATLTPGEASTLVRSDGLTHLISLERVGPSHTAESIRAQAGVDSEILQEFLDEVSEPQRNRLYSMRGVDITNLMSPGHLLIEAAIAVEPRILTIGIGDGGNEIGMGKIPWRVIRKNIARGGLIACRVPTTYLIVSGISNWGAYGLGIAANVLRGHMKLADLLAESTEEAILRAMVERGPLVDGVLGKQAISVDGLPFDRYIAPFKSFRLVLENCVSR